MSDSSETKTHHIMMTISLPGVLSRAAETCNRSKCWKTRTLSNSLELLHTHLEKLRNDPSLHREFFELWSSQ